MCPAAEVVEGLASGAAGSPIVAAFTRERSRDSRGMAPSLPVSGALKVICPRCRQEGKPSLLVTIDIPGDDREVHNLCWTHRLRLLGRGEDPTPAPDTGAR